MRSQQLKFNKKGRVDIVPACWLKNKKEEEQEHKGDSVQSYYILPDGASTSCVHFVQCKATELQP